MKRLGDYRSIEHGSCCYSCFRDEVAKALKHDLLISCSSTIAAIAVTRDEAIIIDGELNPLECYCAE